MREEVKPSTAQSASPAGDEGAGHNASEALATPIVPTQAQIKHLFRNYQDSLSNQRIYALVCRFKEGGVA